MPPLLLVGIGSLLKEADVDHVTFTPFNRTYPLSVRVSRGESERPSAGWNAVSVTIWKVFGFPESASRMTPQRRIGRSILLYYLP